MDAELFSQLVNWWSEHSSTIFLYFMHVHIHTIQNPIVLLIFSVKKPVSLHQWIWVRDSIRHNCILCLIIDDNKKKRFLIQIRFITLVYHDSDFVMPTLY